MTEAEFQSLLGWLGVLVKPIAPLLARLLPSVERLSGLALHRMDRPTGATP